MRAFIGIKLDKETTKRIDNLQKSMYQEGVRGNYTLLSNIHLTLSFLGEIREEDICTIKSIIETLQVPKEIKIVKICMLKDMIICEVEKKVELLAMQKELTDKLKINGFKVDDKKYYPHITLVRRANEEFFKEVFLTSNVNKIILFESTRINNRLCYLEK